MTQKPKQIMEPSLQDVLYNHKEDILKSIHCVNIGKIQAFDSENQTADILISYKKVISEDPNGTKTLQEYPVLLQCPCIVLRGGLGSLRMPITANDYCIVLFNDKDIDNWYAGQEGAAPNTERKHDLSDGIAIVGLGSLITSLDNYLSNQVSLEYDNSKMELKTNQIDITATLLKVIGGLQGTGQVRGATLKADNGATGSMSAASPTGQITVVDGIVTSITP